MQENYKGLSITKDPVGDAAIAIRSNFVTLADRTGMVNFSSTNPTASDDSTRGYSVWSKWFNSISGEMFYCVDSSPGAAIWQPLNSLAADKNPQASNHIVAKDFDINVRTIGSDTTFVMTAKDVRFKVSAIDFKGNDIVNFGNSIYFSSSAANNNISSDTGSLTFTANNIRIGGMGSTWTSSIGADSSYLCDSGGMVSFSIQARECASGTVCMWPTMTAPNGWVLCDGSAYDGTNASYTLLWNALGTTWGGTGQSSFNVPDFRGRALFGVDGTTEFYHLGTSGGAKTVSLNSTHTPSHNHGLYDPGTTAGRASCYGTSLATTVCGAYPTGTYGSGTAHENLNPYTVICWIIKL